MACFSEEMVVCALVVFFVFFCFLFVCLFVVLVVVVFVVFFWGEEWWKSAYADNLHIVLSCFQLKTFRSTFLRVLLQLGSSPVKNSAESQLQQSAATFPIVFLSFGGISTAFCRHTVVFGSVASLP